LHSFADYGSVAAFVKSCGDVGTIVFLDLPPNNGLFTFVETLVEPLQRAGYDVITCVHPPNEDDVQIEPVRFMSALRGINARVASRPEHFSCSTLVKGGEFQNALCLVAKASPIGLVTAMKATGCPGIMSDSVDRDAAILARDERDGLSPLASLLSAGFDALPLPSFNPEQSAAYAKYNEALKVLFQDTVFANSGDQAAYHRLAKRCGRAE
jgi:hypothetical protein